MPGVGVLPLNTYSWSFASLLHFCHQQSCILCYVMTAFMGLRKKCRCSHTQLHGSWCLLTGRSAVRLRWVLKCGCSASWRGPRLFYYGQCPPFMTLVTIAFHDRPSHINLDRIYLAQLQAHKVLSWVRQSNQQSAMELDTGIYLRTFNTRAFTLFDYLTHSLTCSTKRYVH